MSYALAYIQSQKKREVKTELTNIINVDFRQPKQYYSEILDDTFSILEGGEIKFISGAFYNRSEVDKVRGLDNNAKKKLHLLKRIFNGVIM